MNSRDIERGRGDGVRRGKEKIEKREKRERMGEKERDMNSNGRGKKNNTSNIEGGRREKTGEGEEKRVGDKRQAEWERKKSK